MQKEKIEIPMRLKSRDTLGEKNLKFQKTLENFGNISEIFLKIILKILPPRVE
jgi:hypothetical protein